MADTVTGTVALSRYYWQIIAFDQTGARKEGPVWQFQTGNTPPAAAELAWPAIGAKITPTLELLLQWRRVVDPNPNDQVRYDVYLGLEPEPPLFQRDLSTAALVLAEYPKGQTLYWKVVTKDSPGAQTPGPVWSFVALDEPTALGAGDLPTDAVLKKSLGPYSVDATTMVAPGGQLSIEAGTKILFGTQGKLEVQGSLHAIGTPGSPIVFTSRQAAPKAGDWEGLVIKNLDQVEMHNCVVEYGGASDAPCVLLQGTAPVIRDSTIRHCNAAGVRIDSGSPHIEGSSIHHNGGQGIYVANGSPSIERNRIAQSGKNGILIEGGAAKIYENTFAENSAYDVDAEGQGSVALRGNQLTQGLFFNTDKVVELTGNAIAQTDPRPMRLSAEWVGRMLQQNTLQNLSTQNTLEVLGGNLTRDASWDAQFSAYKILGAIAVAGVDGEDQRTTLSIAAGTVLRFDSYGALNIGSSGASGTLLAEGTAEKPILFTSAKASPKPGDWSGIRFPAGSDQSVLRHCVVEYGGSSYERCVNITQSSPLLEHTTIARCANEGVYTESGSPTLDQCTVRENGSHGIYVYSGSPTIEGCRIEQNQKDGIYVSGGKPVLNGSTMQGNGALGLEVSRYASGGTVQDCTIQGGMTLGVVLDRLSGNTIGIDPQKPLRVPAGAVGDLASNNSLAGTATRPRLEVIEGTITKDSDWTPKFQYVVLGNVYVSGQDGEDQKTTLTLDPGVEILFARSAGLTAGYNYLPGELIAQGTPEAPISLRAQDGTWAGLTLYSRSDGSKLKNVLIENTAGNCLTVSYSSPSIESTEISGCGSNGVYVEKGSPVIQGCSISGALGQGIYVYSGNPLVQGNVIENTGRYGVAVADYAEGSYLSNTIRGPVYLNSTSIKAFSGNEIHDDTEKTLRLPPDLVGSMQGENHFVYTDRPVVWVRGGTVTKDAIWPSAFEYRILDAIWVAHPQSSQVATLTLEPGSLLKFNSYGALQVARTGRLLSQGSPESPIRLTSNQQTAAPGDWRGLTLYQAPGLPSLFEKTVIEYAGPSGYAAVTIYEGAPVFRRVTIQHIAGDGIYVNDGSPTLSESNLVDIKVFGVYNRSYQVIRAENNWWGDANGPLDTSDDRNSGGLYNPNTTGVKVSDRVDYDSWSSVMFQ